MTKKLTGKAAIVGAIGSAAVAAAGSNGEVALSASSRLVDAAAAAA